MSFSACACMGKIYGEPYCPCEMRNRGIPSSDAHIKANAEAKIRFDAIDWSKYKIESPAPTVDNKE